MWCGNGGTNHHGRMSQGWLAAFWNSSAFVCWSAGSVRGEPLVFVTWPTRLVSSSDDVPGMLLNIQFFNFSSSTDVEWSSCHIDVYTVTTARNLVDNNELLQHAILFNQHLLFMQLIWRWFGCSITHMSLHSGLTHRGWALLHRVLHEAPSYCDA